MNVNYTARQISVTPDIKKYCHKRLKSLEKFIGPLTDVDIVLTMEKYRTKVEINLKTRKLTLNVEEETHDMYNSLNAAFDNLEKRAKKGKEKSREKKRRKENREMESYSSSPPGSMPERIISSEDYSLKPMTVEEAVLQLEYERREVFLFRKSDSEKWAVVYRRKDGRIGLVEPE
ncbi:MAG: ribosome hibernation-promoting factor, HPF/YfiA family [Candidatus Aminicenantales bacterium]